MKGVKVVRLKEVKMEEVGREEVRGLRVGERSGGLEGRREWLGGVREKVKGGLRWGWCKWGKMGGGRGGSYRVERSS
ncbi:hypothetical protein, partial [Micrococcus luteus]|uniref:hypothetical protein n=1 Tax=Micrococcus luteus TaxID=1270 RepID=UPI0011A8A16C